MVLKETISAVLQHQAEQMTKQEPGLLRDFLNDTNLIKSFVLVIMGVRRTGKSTLLKQLLRYNFASNLFLNFEDPRLSSFELSDFIKLDEIFYSAPKDVMAFDEIQNVDEWEKYIRNKQDEGQSIIITGSNASLLGKEFGSRLTGRYLTRELFPFSFKEFLEFMKLEASAESLYRYMIEGGFPEYLKTREDDVLVHLMDDIIFRDIAVRHGIKQYKVLRQLAIYLISNSGKQYSLNKLKNMFEVGSVRSIADYISYFEDSYLLFSLPKFGFSISKQILNPRKVYSIDTGLACVNSLSFSEDSGRKLENLIFLHLRKKFRNLYYFSEKYECDFIIANKGKPNFAIQVCYRLTADSLDRELRGLEEAMSLLNLKYGEIITFDQEDSFILKGKNIRAIPAWKYLIDVENLT